jgi:energy-coupling factor transporter ATP-binding protein EcfA2
MNSPGDNSISWFNPRSRQSHFSLEHGVEFPVRPFIVEQTGKMPCNFEGTDTYDDRLLEFLDKNAEKICYRIGGKLQDVLQRQGKYRNSSHWYHYKNCFVQVETDDDMGTSARDDRKKTYYTINGFWAAGESFPLEDFAPFITELEGTKIRLFVKNSYGEYTFEPLSIKVPAGMDIALNYGEDFVPVYSEIKRRLSERESGLYMFHGPPGTGKSSLIKLLAGELKRDFIYIPTTMLETFTSDPACMQMLIHRANSVLVLEDAEKLIARRHGDGADASSISALLNLSDGILSDILSMPLIITYNCEPEMIDEALMRKGRLMMDYRFSPLDHQSAARLCRHLGYDEEVISNIKSPLTLADIYNLQINVRYGSQPKHKQIGFSPTT